MSNNIFTQNNTANKPNIFAPQGNTQTNNVFAPKPNTSPNTNVFAQNKPANTFQPQQQTNTTNVFSNPNASKTLLKPQPYNTQFQPQGQQSKSQPQTAVNSAYENDFRSFVRQMGAMTATGHPQNLFRGIVFNQHDEAYLSKKEPEQKKTLDEFWKQQANGDYKLLDDLKNTTAKENQRIREEAGDRSTAAKEVYALAVNSHKEVNDRIDKITEVSIEMDKKEQKQQEEFEKLRLAFHTIQEKKLHKLSESNTYFSLTKTILRLNQIAQRNQYMSDEIEEALSLLSQQINSTSAAIKDLQQPQKKDDNVRSMLDKLQECISQVQINMNSKLPLQSENVSPNRIENQAQTRDAQEHRESEIEFITGVKNGLKKLAQQIQQRSCELSVMSKELDRQ